MQMVASALGYCFLSFVVLVKVQSEQGELKSFAAHSGTEWRPSVTTPNLKPSFLCKMKSSSGVQRVYIPRGLVLPCLSEFSTVCCDPHSQGFGIVNKAEIDVFLELSCLLSYKKESIWISANELDEPGACYTERSKSERERQILISMPIYGI